MDNWIAVDVINGTNGPIIVQAWDNFVRYHLGTSIDSIDLGLREFNAKNVHGTPNIKFETIEDMTAFILIFT